MRSLIARNAAASAVVFFALTACGGAGAGAPSAGSAAQGMPARIGGEAAPPNRSGQYAGKVDDSVYGAGKTTESLAQNGSALGGTLYITFASGKVTESQALTVDGTSAKGTTIIEITGGTYCAFSETSTYDSTTNEVKGKYSAIHGCTGETGSFEAKHQCTYVNGADADIRPENGPKPC
jgi:hypothetical protein